MFKDLYSNEDGLQVGSIVKAALSILATIILISIVLSNVYQVRDNQYVVIRQFGEVVRIVDKPGYNFKIPFIQSSEIIPKSIQTQTVPQALINTSDKKQMQIDSYALFRVVDPKMMIQNMRSLTAAENRMGDQIYSLIRSELGNLNYDQLISSSDATGRSGVTESILTKVNGYLKENKAGIVLVDVRLKRTDLPPENEQSVYKRMISERASKSQEYTSQGIAEKSRIIADTDRDVKKMLAQARTEAEKIRGEGEGEAGRIYNESYSKDPKFYELYRTLESYKKTINDETIIMLPADSKYTKMLTGK